MWGEGRVVEEEKGDLGRWLRTPVGALSSLPDTRK